MHVCIIDRDSRPHRAETEQFNRAFAVERGDRITPLSYGMNPAGYRFDLIVIAARPRTENESLWLEQVLLRANPNAAVVSV